MTFWIRTVILMVGLFCGISHAEDKPMVRCEASAVHIGGEGQVTCHYPMDLSHINCVVSIEQFVDDSEKTVLECVRDRISQCDYVRQGYRVTNFTGNTLTVTIPKVTDEHMGRYGCSLADRMTSYGYDLCTFEVKNRPMVHCEASAVHFGGEGQVTCHYPMDLSQNDYAVSIEQFGDESEKTVLDCVWGGIRQCDNVRQGYRIANFTGNTLTVTIPKVTDEHMGRYGCALFDKETSYASDLCTFEVKDRKSRCEASVENIGGRGQVTCHYPMDLTGVHCVVDIGQFVDGAETHILSCMWKDITQHDCTDIRQGYTITNFTGNTLTVTIPEVTDEHRGRYRCSLVDEIIHDNELCDVVVKRANPPSHQSESSMKGEASDQSGATPPSHQSESSMKGEANDQSGSDKGMSSGGIAGLASAVLLIGAIAVAVLVCRYRQCRRQNGNNPATAKFDNSADSQEKEVCRVTVDDHLEGTDAITGGKGTNYELTCYSPESPDSGYGDTKSENGDTIGSRYNSLENREMAENAERHDAASDAEDTADNTTSLLSDQESRLKQEGKEKEHEE